MKVLLILIDGMRPDAMVQIPAAKKVMEKAAYKLEGRTVYPSCTLPCHMSLFYSRPPLTHGVTSNTYTARVRLKNGLMETMRKEKKKTVMFYSWEELRDLYKPGCMTDSFFVNGDQYGYMEANARLTQLCVDYLRKETPDFAFLYLGAPDSAGHKVGWMTESYFEALEQSWACAEKAMENLPEEYAVVITADHGGHDKRHTTFMKEDMTIPVLLLNAGLPTGETVKEYNIMDIAPTVATLMGMEKPMEWKGKSLVKEV